MTIRSSKSLPALVLCAASAAIGSTTISACAQTPAPPGQEKTVQVEGTGTHRFSESIEHSRVENGTTVTIRSTDIIDLRGDLNGEILYHPVTVIDLANYRLTNTGHQVFSGTILGSEPVLLFDDDFRFDVDLMQGTVRGEVFLERSLAGRKTRCELIVEGIAAPPGQDSDFTYSGECTWRQSEKAKF